VDFTHNKGCPKPSLLPLIPVGSVLTATKENRYSMWADFAIWNYGLQEMNAAFQETGETA
jgi:hypothetical protein